MELCKKHDRRAQNELYLLCYGFMMSICSRYEFNKDDAESLLNQSFLKVLNGLKTYRTEVPFKLWLRKITVNTIIDEFRKNKKLKSSTKSLDFQEEINDKLEHDINDYLKKTSGEEIYELIKGLPDMSQKVFNLFVVDGYSHKEIAEMLSIPYGTSRWLLNSAKEELRKKIIKINRETAQHSVK